jgi:hypothetical protein
MIFDESLLKQHGLAGPSWSVEKKVGADHSEKLFRNPGNALIIYMEHSPFPIERKNAESGSAMGLQCCETVWCQWHLQTAAEKIWARRGRIAATTPTRRGGGGVRGQCAKRSETQRLAEDPLKHPRSGPSRLTVLSSVSTHCLSMTILLQHVTTNPGARNGPSAPALSGIDQHSERVENLILTSVLCCIHPRQNNSQSPT